MEHRRGVDGREVIGGVDGIPHVRERQAGRQAVVGDATQVQRRKDERRRQERRREHQNSSGKDASGPARVERAETDPSRAFTFVHEQAGDQEPRQDEEHVHTDEPRVGSRHSHVTEEHEQDRDPAQTLKVWPVPRIACARRRHRMARYRSQVTAGAVPDRCRPHVRGLAGPVFLAGPNHRSTSGIWTPDRSESTARRSQRATIEWPRGRGRRGCSDDGSEPGDVGRRRLVRRARTGDAAAFEVLVDTRIDRCYRLAGRSSPTTPTPPTPPRTRSCRRGGSSPAFAIRRSSTAGSTGSSRTPPDDAPASGPAPRGVGPAGRRGRGKPPA